MSRATDTLLSIPLTTLSIISLCTIIYLYQLLADPFLQNYTMNPRAIIHLHEYYRLITSTLFHGGWMHIGMNMMSTMAISTLLERRFGTLRQMITILWAILLTGLVYTLVAYIAHLIFGYDNLMYSHSVGFSGVIFHLSVLEASLNPHRTRSVFGFVTVPSYLYPWALLIVLQFVMPQISFLGHLSGILTGTLQLYGLLDVIVVSDEYLIEMEHNWSMLRHLTSRPNFVKTPGLDSGIQIRRDPSSLRTSLYRGLMMVWKFVKDVLETIGVIIFGRGRNVNSNIQMSERERRDLISNVDDDGDDDDDWVGLPPAPSPNEVESRVV